MATRKIEGKLLAEKSFSLLIAGRKVAVKFVDEIDPESSAIGRCHFENSLIEIEKGLDYQVRGVTLLHELLHLIYYVAGIHEYNGAANDGKVDAVAELGWQLLQQF